ncbi:hypothetical protein GCM10023201_49550 [Actinomycetospora corticicola]|uniref:Uncharacterized protein n=1 Tax=Actinomycetospora corticicola TaxID=663602 RepID=A0A7Y9J787_9PSEU|nr:hypothetical protein [Actinomycetospora corticicola]NYD37776.1 hypothetical protein [Actinomycetospora corticicola]
MTDDGAGPDPGRAADLTGRAVQADDDARVLAARLARTALDVAATLDRVAATREARAAQVGGAAAEVFRASARRARSMAESERVESRELRRAWRLPD